MSDINSIMNNRFEITFIFTLSWFASGIFLDAWAHTFFGSELETFFTPWHFVLYTGFLSIAVLLVSVMLFNIKNLRHSESTKTLFGTFSNAIPEGYGFAYVGVILFLFVGMGDFLWHEAFGFEANVEAQYSPTHLLLGLGMLLIWSSPLIAAWRKEEVVNLSWKKHLAVFFSSTFLLFIFTFFTAVYNPFLVPLASNTYRPPVIASIAHSESASVQNSLILIYQGLGISAIITSSVFISGIILAMLRRFQLPSGWAFLMLFIHGVLVSLIKGTYFVIFPLMVGATFTELGHQLLIKPHSKDRLPSLNIRIFAFLITFPLFLTYFVSIIVLEGTWWTIHLWLGAPFLSGIVSVLISYLVFPLPLKST